MPVVESTFKTTKLMKNGHMQTAFPYFFRSVSTDLFSVERIELKDGDFIDLDFYNGNSDDLVVMSHGLEGSSDRSYIRGQSHYLCSERNMDIAAWNMRSCSGVINRKPHFYHAAQTDDLEQVIQHCLKKKSYKRVHLVGFSLGGALTSNYVTRVGRQTVNNLCSVSCVSSPLSLGRSIEKLSSSKVGMIYTNVFIKTMKEKVLEKKGKGILDIDEKILNQCKNFIDFDELITAPSFNFSNAQEYYDYASSYEDIKEVKIPTLLIQAKDDPFLTRESYPLRAADKNPFLHLEITTSGGHLGFIATEPNLHYWYEKRVADFIQSCINES